jgi:hypothetical protein
VNLKKDNIEIDLPQLGCLFFSAATKKEEKPNRSICLNDLTEIDINHRSIALNLISFLVDGSPNRFKIITLLRHPLFTQCNEEARSKLTNEVMGKEMGQGWKDEQKLKDWISNLDQGKFVDEKLEDLEEIVKLKS